MSVREDESPRTVIYTMIAADRDAGQNGTVIYEIVGGNGQSKPEKERNQFKSCVSTENHNTKLPSLCIFIYFHLSPPSGG